MTVADIVKSRLCTGCGICQNTCPSAAISMSRRYNGYRPVIHTQVCKVENGCHMCTDVCPGPGIDLPSFANKLFPNTYEDDAIGRYLECYSGHCTNPNIRYHAASGGLLTGLLTWMLQKGMIQGAIVTRFRSDQPLEPQVIIAKNPEDIFAARSSKYCPVSLEGVLREMESMDGRFAVVGLPCHIHGIRKLLYQRRSLRERLKWLMGIYCSSTRTFLGTEYVLSRLRVRPEEVKYLTYRDEGCLGNMRIELKDGKVISRPFEEYYIWMRSFFIPFRCSLCVDHFAELADLSFGDLHIPEFWHDKVGVSSLVVRSRSGADLVDRAKHEGVLELVPLAPVLLKKSQQGMIHRKKVHVPQRIRFLRWFGFKTPCFGANRRKFSVKEWIGCMRSSVILYSEMAVGRRQWLWGLIDWCNKKLF